MALFSRLFFTKQNPVAVSSSILKPFQALTTKKPIRTDGLIHRMALSNVDTVLRIFVNPLSMMSSQEMGNGTKECTSEKSEKILCPPDQKGMKVLDKSTFTKKLKIPTVLISEQQLHQNISVFRPYFLKVIQMKPVNPYKPDSGLEDTSTSNISKKKIFLNPEIIKCVEKKELSQFIVENLKLDAEIAEAVYFEEIDFTYENWSWNQIIKSILPDDLETVSGFSHIGHIIHLNLRDHLLPYKNIIAQVLLDKVRHAKTVVNKLNIIDSTYRNFQMEILAGEPKTVVSVNQSLCVFEFDFAKVYWNPRLCTEHERIFKMLKPGDVLYDVFAGVGPFSIPVGKKKCFVFANDLNPDSFFWLQNNVKKNKVHLQIQCFNKDGRNFIQQDVSAHLKQLIKCEDFDFKKQSCHVTMNLPAIAVSFLDSFWNLLPSDDPETDIPSNLALIVHVYCFIKDIDGYKEKALKLVETNLQFELPKDNVMDIQFVRNVAPNKEMLRVSFKMPHDVLSSKLSDKSNECQSISMKRNFVEVE